MFEPVSVRSRNIRSGRSGALERASTTTNATTSAADAASRPIVSPWSPTVLHGAGHRVDEQHQAAGDRGGAGHVEVPVRHVRAALVHEARRHHEHERTDRHVDEEDPRPAEGTRERAAEQHARSAAAAGDGAPDAEREVAVASFLEGRRQDRERRGREQSRAEPLQRAEGDQRALRPGETVEQREDREDRRAPP